jgi:eukaryotic-like serine/threonine-protein kinase
VAGTRRDGALIGRIVGNYELKAVLGEGGMGTVYLAEHPVIGRRAAVKVLRRALADDEAHVSRFMNEARAANAIRHANIIDILDLGLLPEGLPYLMMELLEGESLGSRLRAVGRLPVAQALEIVRQTASALGAAHDKGIVHRDLKPDNLFLVPDASLPWGERVKVLDFGIAKLVGNDLARGLATQSGILLGTPLYMSPEQCRGVAAEVDHRTDIYSLSVILYQMLVGEAPFVAEGTGDVMMMHVGQDPLPVRRRNPEVSPLVEAALVRGLAKPRAGRFQSMRELTLALTPGGAPAETLQLPIGPSARPLGSTMPLPSPVFAGEPVPPTGSATVRRRPVVAAGMLAVAAGAGLVWLGRQVGRLQSPAADSGQARPRPRPAGTQTPPGAPAAVDVARAGRAPRSPFLPEPAPAPASPPATRHAPVSELPVLAPAAPERRPKTSAVAPPIVTPTRPRPGAQTTPPRERAAPAGRAGRRTQLW